MVLKKTLKRKQPYVEEGDNWDVVVAIYRGKAFGGVEVKDVAGELAVGQGTALGGVDVLGGEGGDGSDVR